MENPVLTREIRTRTRTRKSRKVRLALGIPALLIIAVSYWQLFAAMMESRGDLEGAWVMVSFIQLILICFLTPGLLSNSISQEKEQRTWGMLLITRLTSWQIVSGKLIARILPMLGLMVLFIPFMAYSAVASDLPARVIIGTYVVLIACVTLFGIQAMLWSWLLRRTSVATAASYGLVFFLVAGTAIIEGLVQSVERDYSGESMIVWFNPFYTLAMVQEWIHRTPNQDNSSAIFMVVVYLTVAAAMLLAMTRSLEKTTSE